MWREAGEVVTSDTDGGAGAPAATAATTAGAGDGTATGTHSGTGTVSGWSSSRERRAPAAPRGLARVRGALWRAVGAVASLWLLVLLVAGWWFASAGSTSAYFPPLKTIVHRLYDLWIVGDTAHELVPSLEHFAVGYVIAGVAGIAVGAVLWSVPLIRESASPLLYFLYVLPAPALLPVAITLFGIEAAMKVAIIAFAAVWPTLLNTLDGMRGVDSVKLDSARALGLGRLRTVRSVVLPAALPQIVAGLRNSLQVSIILMVVSEMAASTSGIGYFILTAQQSFLITDMWTGIIVLAFVGSALNVLFVAVERRLLSWHYGARAAEEKS